jgi:hypothetical protein
MNHKLFIQRIDELESKKIEGLKFMRNRTVFLSFLHRQRKVDVKFWEDEIVLGSFGAPIQLTVACNPFCEPCAVAHRQLEALLKLYPTKVCINIRFTIWASDESNRRRVAASSIVNSLLSGNKHAVDEWFATMELAQFNRGQHLGLDHHLIAQVLQRHDDWVRDAMITHTPTIFMNGYELPEQYCINDLRGMINLILERPEIHPSGDADGGY